MKNRHFSKVQIILPLLWLFEIGVVNAQVTSNATGEPPKIQHASNLSETTNYQVIVDTRPLSSCQNSSLAGAVCLPVEDVLAPNRRLANWSGILWLLGSANLKGNEHALVIGQRPDRRDFMAGLLLLAGQQRITVAQTPVSELINNNDKPVAGTTRSTTRTNVYTAPMRSELIVLQSELKQLINANNILLDGRPESEYYGTIIRSSRGGHIPGASHSPVSDWRSKPVDSAANYESLNPIAYAHDAYDSLIFLAALHSAGVNAAVYLPGWVEWASNGSLPADSVSYPNKAKGITPTPICSAATTLQIGRTEFMIAATAVLSLIVASFYTGRKLSRRTA